MQDRAEGSRNDGGAPSLDIYRMNALNDPGAAASQGVRVGLGVKDPFQIVESPSRPWGSQVGETEMLKCMPNRTKGTDTNS